MELGIARAALGDLRKSIACALLVALWAPVTASGQTYAIPVGTETVQVPTPKGFAETSRRSQDLWKAAQALTTPASRVAAHYMTDADIKAFAAGGDVDPKQYMLLLTPSRAEHSVTTQAQFDRLRAGTIELQKNLAAKLEPRLSAEIDRVSKAISTASGEPIKIKMGVLVPVSIDRDEARLLQYTFMANVTASGGGASGGGTMLTNITYCFVKGKVVLLGVYRKMKSPEDLEFIRSFGKAWGDSVVATN